MKIDKTPIVFCMMKNHDKNWMEHIDELLEQYSGKYLFVLNLLYGREMSACEDRLLQELVCMQTTENLFDAYKCKMRNCYVDVNTECMNLSDAQLNMVLEKVDKAEIFDYILVVADMARLDYLNILLASAEYVIYYTDDTKHTYKSACEEVEEKKTESDLQMPTPPPTVPKMPQAPVPPIPPPPSLGQVPLVYVPKEGETSVLSMPSMNDDSADTKSNACLINVKTQEQIDISKQEFMLGKGTDNDYVIYDNTTVSRNHAKIFKEGSYYYMMDLHSTNYSYINDNILVPLEKNRIQSGDRIRLSNEEFVFNE